MLEFLIDNIFVSFGGALFQQVVGIPMGTCDLFNFQLWSIYQWKKFCNSRIIER
jgi:hypothetical protein